MKKKSDQNDTSKFKSRKTEIDGIKFDSKLEAKRYLELKSLAASGAIGELRWQVRYLLIPSQRIGGKLAERAVEYVADFVYTRQGQIVVEDVKSPYTKTPAYVIKRKLMLERHGIRIEEYMQAKKKAG